MGRKQKKVTLTIRPIEKDYLVVQTINTLHPKVRDVLSEKQVEDLLCKPSLQVVIKA